MRNRHAFVLAASLLAAGCSGTSSTETVNGIPKDIADDMKARGLTREPKADVPAPAAAEFKPYKSPDGLFVVNFPGEPRKADLGPSIPMKRSAMESYTITKGTRGYAVLCSHYDEARDPATELKDLTDLHISRTLEGKLVSSKDVTLKGRPGKEIVIVDDDRARRAKLLVDGNLVYQVSVDLPAAEIDGDAAKAFVESFQILKD